MNKITIIINGGVCQEVIGLKEYNIIDYDTLTTQEDGKTRDEIDQMVEQAEALHESRKDDVLAQLLYHTNFSQGQCQRIIDNCTTLTIGGVIDACMNLGIKFTGNGLQNMFAASLLK